jgi:phospholipid/cholesterol/gamma-HCH transport system substrate-binding protein
VKVETRVGLFILGAIAIFIYLSFNIRALRFDKHLYHTYKAYFDDTGGLTVKASAKIAGVDVGWVESIDLLEDGKAQIVMMVNKNVKLAKNAYATIRQDGLIGTKNLEIEPGDPSTGLLLPGSTLSMPGKTPTSVGELLDQFREIAVTIQDITSSLKNVFASRKGEETMRQALNSVAVATDRIADFSGVLQRTLNKNEQNINDLVADFRVTMQELKTRIPTVSDDIHGVSESFQTNFKSVGDASKKVGGAFEHVEDAAVQAHDTFKEAGQVMEKINTGKGVVGKLINEDETYSDLKQTIRGLKNYVSKSQSLMLNFDIHSETLLRNPNNKGYLEVKLRPNSDTFYLVQLVGAEKGSITRDTTSYVRKDEKGATLNPSDLDIPLYKKVEFANQVERTVVKKNDVLFGLQFGKRFDRLALRIGIMENTFGGGLDYYVPIGTNKFHWITTVEAFDFTGTQRLDDKRPHVKWLNKVFFSRNIYTAFGVDDACSKRNANPFFGGGLRFGDDDLKYFASYLPLKK